MKEVHAWAAPAADRPLERTLRRWGALGPEEVEVVVESCGICYSDISVLENEWGNTAYPVVPGHEIVGRVAEVGDFVKGVAVGDRVGIGWTAGSCMHCRWCLSGDQHLCASAQPTIVGHDGGFAERVRAHWAWAIPIPEGLDAGAAGPLLCGGITVFKPFVEYGISPTGRVGVVGIGGLGHMALKFARAWGCHVTAFTSSPSKFDEARQFGAHDVLSSRDSDGIRQAAGSLDLLLVTVNASLDWNALMSTLGPHGRLHVVGAVPEPIPVSALDLIGGQRSISGSPTGAPVDIATMLLFAARHAIAPTVERFPMDRVNDALEHLRAGRARYRIVLDANAG